MTDPAENTIRGIVTSVVFKGVHYEMLVESEAYEWMIQSTDPHAEGSTVGLTFDPEDIHVMAKSEDSPDRRPTVRPIPDATAEGVEEW